VALPSLLKRPAFEGAVGLYGNSYLGLSEAPLDGKRAKPLEKRPVLGVTTICSFKRGEHSHSSYHLSIFCGMPKASGESADTKRATSSKAA
jgi:hypothetical protein